MKGFNKDWTASAGHRSSKYFSIYDKLDNIIDLPMSLYQ